MLPYALAQILGGFCGAALVYANYESAIDAYEDGDFRTHLTASIFSTYPQTFMTTVGQFFSEVVATALLVICLFAIGDERNNPAGDFGPVVICLLIFALGAAFVSTPGIVKQLITDYVGLGNRLCSQSGSRSWTKIAYLRYRLWQ